MEFFVFLNEHPTYTLLFQLTNAENEVTVGHIVDRYTKIIQKTKDESFDSKNFKVFINNFTMSLHNVVLEVTDLNESIFNYSTLKFDLILSEETPIALDFTEPSEDQQQSNEDMFEEAVAQATVAMNNRDSKSASSNIKKALSLDPSSPIPYQLQVKMYFKFHRYKSAMDVALNNYRRFPNDPECLYLLGKAEQKSGHHNEAIQYFKRLLLLTSSNCINYDLMNLSIARSLYELKEYEDAYNLVQGIFKSNPLNLKASVLLAKILLKKGLYHDAIHIIMNNFSIQPDHKQSIKFIGLNVCNERQVQILKNELGDSINNPHITFFIGHILNKYGSCKAAHTFFMESFKKSSFDSSIFIGTFKNMIALNEEISSYIEIILQYTNALSQQQNEFSSLFSEKILFTDDFKENKTKIPVIIPFEGEKVENKFKLNQIDIIWAIINIESFLFNNGFISDAQTLATKLQNIISKFDFSKTVISNEIKFHEHLLTLTQTIPKPLQSIKKLYVFGDEHSISLSWRTINYMGEPHILVPLLIEHLHPTDLLSQNFSPLKYSYRRKVSCIPHGSHVLFACCEIDCSDWLITFNGQTELNTLDEVLQVQMESLVRVVTELADTRELHVWVHPMYRMPVGTLEIIQSFNSRLQSNISALNRSDVCYLDIFDALTDSANGSITLRPEYSRGAYLDAGYISLVESALRK